MNWDDYDIFCRVAEHGGFTAASRAIARPKSSLSAAVARLELALQTRLFERTTRRLRLTESGEALYRGMGPLFSGLREAHSQAIEERHAVGGTLRIASPCEFAAHHLAQVACAMLAKYRQLRIELEVQHGPVNPLDQGYDIVFAMLDEPLPASTIVVRRVFSLERGLFASPEFLLANPEPEHPRQLAQMALLAGANETEWSFLGPDGTIARIPIQSAPLSSSNADVRLQAAVGGLGIIRVTSTFCQPAVDTGRLRRLMIHYTCDPLRVYALLPAKRLMPEKVRLFLDALYEQASAAAEAPFAP